MKREPSNPLVVTEHWTHSHTALALSSDIATLTEIAELLDLPSERVTITNSNRAVLGLWLEHVESYEQLKHKGLVVPLG